MLPAVHTRRQPRFVAPRWPDGAPTWLDVDRCLAAAHPARLLAAVVARLDLDQLHASYAGRGSAAFPPRLLLAFVLLMLHQGVTSPAAWARQARINDEAKWLLRGLTPSRSQLYAFRDRVADFLDDWHRQVLRLAIAERFCDPRHACLDGTFVAAYASRHRLVTAHTVERRLRHLRLVLALQDQLPTAPADVAGAVAADVVDWVCACVLLLVLGLGAVLGLLPGVGAAPAWVAATVTGQQRQLTRYERAWQQFQDTLPAYERQQKERAKSRRVPAEKRKACVSDVEATLGRDKLGVYRPLYNLQVLTTLDGTFALGYDVLPQANDQNALRPMLEHARQQLGQLPPAAVVDDGYINILDLQWCEQQGVTVYGPPPAAEPARKAKAKAKAKAKLPKEAFRWDAAEQALYCPEGRRLDVSSRTTAHRQGGVELPVSVYRCAGEHCQACPRQPDCTTNPKKGRVVKRYDGEEVVARLTQRMSQPRSQDVYRQRKTSAERQFADGKQHRGLGQCRCYGRRRVKAQAGLTLLASNGLQLVKRLRERETASPRLALPLVTPN